MTMKHNNWKRMECVAFLIFSFSLFLITNANAQSFTQRIQQKVQGEGTVTLHQDKVIDDLVNGPAQTAPAEKKQATGKTATNTGEKPKTNSNQKEEKTTQPPQSDMTEVPADTMNTAKKTGRTYKTTGYRVQAYAGGNSRADRQKAEQTGSQLRMLFPTESVYTHFRSPRWICRMGNYRTYEEALQKLHEVRKLGFSSSTIVKTKITVQY